MTSAPWHFFGDAVGGYAGALKAVAENLVQGELAGLNLGEGRVRHVEA